jgi:putative two-component system response regulator
MMVSVGAGKQVRERAKVFIVDDAPENIRMLGGMLKDEYEISFAKTGGDALEKIDFDPDIDLILLDIMLPDISGHEICLKLKQNEETQHIPIIFITAMDQEADEEKGFNLGAVDYITKPFSLTVVKARVKTHVQLKRHQDLLKLLIQEKTAEIEKTQDEYLRLFMKAGQQ